MGIISYFVDNDKRFQAGLGRAVAAVGDLRRPLSLIAADFYRSEQAIFKLKGPGQYPDFKSGGQDSRYARFKEKTVGFKYPLLMRTGALAASVLSPSAPGAIFQLGPKSLSIGTSIRYGIYHQSDAPRTKIPLRKFLFIGPESTFANSEQAGRLERWLNILNDYVLKAMQ